MRILFTGRNFKQGLKISDQTNFMAVADSLGHVCVDSIADKPDVLVCVDYDRSALSLVKQARRIGIKTVLICCEPSVVLPQNNQTRTAKHFDKIIRVGRPGSRATKWPQTWREVRKSPGRIQRVVMVNSDKWSFVRGQLYWLRAAIGGLDDRVDTAGESWDRGFCNRFMHRIFEYSRTLASLTVPSFRGFRYAIRVPMNYLGAPADKVEFMSNYSVALVIENSQELITEKLFDAWFAGCVPVYVGPDVSQFGIPCELLVQSMPSIQSLMSSIDEALRIDRAKFLESLDQFLASADALGWQSNKAMEDVLKNLYD